jgi:hypothetical protein
MAGLIAFGSASLLWLVTEELLLEAHEGKGGHVWWVLTGRDTLARHSRRVV